MSSLKFEQIDKIYDNGFKAVSNFNLEISHGEFVVFVGPSGCGKSTMMRMIAGLEEITKGKLKFDNQVVNHKTPRQRGVAMVFQSYALYPHLDVYENMAFGLELEGFDSEFVEKRVKQIAEVLGLSSLLHRKPRELSGGQNQRVAVGRALIRKPNVFLMDEPLSNLDAKHRVVMRSEIVEIHRKTQATTIYVTHDQIEAMTMADKIVVMRDGVIQQFGTPKELYFSPANKFVAGFLGEPPMNFLPCQLQDGHLNVLDTDFNLKLPSRYNNLLNREDGTLVTLGFRPEATVYQDSASGEDLLFDCTVDLAELLGDTINVYVYVGKHMSILKSLPNRQFKLDSALKFVVPQDKIYLFETGGNENTIKS